MADVMTNLSSFFTRSHTARGSVEYALNATMTALGMRRNLWTEEWAR